MSANASPKKTEPHRPQIAVGGVAFNTQGEVLLIQRGQPPNQGHWSLPGGRVEFGESLHDALVREFCEEVNLNIRVDNLICPFEIIESYHYVVMDYLVHIESGALKPGDDAMDAGWFSDTAMKKLVVSDGLLSVIERARTFQ